MTPSAGVRSSAPRGLPEPRSQLPLLGAGLTGSAQARRRPRRGRPALFGHRPSELQRRLALVWVERYFANVFTAENNTGIPVRNFFVPVFPHVNVQFQILQSSSLAVCASKNTGIPVRDFFVPVFPHVNFKPYKARLWLYRNRCLKSKFSLESFRRDLHHALHCAHWLEDPLPSPALRRPSRARP